MYSHSTQIQTEEFFQENETFSQGITSTCLCLRLHHQQTRIAFWAMRLAFLFQPLPRARGQTAKPAIVSSYLFQPLRPKLA